MRTIAPALFAVQLVFMCGGSRGWAQPATSCAATRSESVDPFAPSTVPRASPTAEGSSHRHVRTTEAWIEVLVQKGIANSPTFNCLVSTLDQSDVIIYIQPILLRDGSGRGALKGLLSHQIRTKGNYRYLRIGLARQGYEVKLIGTIAHELQHAIEIARAPDVRSAADVQKLFSRMTGAISCLAGDCTETIEALDVQRAVIDELKEKKSDAGSRDDASRPWGH